MKKILIIEDDDMFLQIYKDKFKGLDYVILSADNGRRGLELAKSDRPDLIMIDIMLPGGFNGFDILEQLKRDDNLKSIPVIIMTNLEKQEQTAINMGANDYFIKSNTSIDKIVERVKFYIEKK